MKSEVLHIVCYSGGHSSAIVAIELVRKFGKENVILLNHNINTRYENLDIKRFKKEVADYLGIEITYANINNELDENKIPNQFEVCENKGTFVNPNDRQILCTYELKTKPFYDYLKTIDTNNIVISYGFDENEIDRVCRRKNFLKNVKIETEFPLVQNKIIADSYNDFLLTDLMNTYNNVTKNKIKLNEFKKTKTEYISNCINAGLLELTTFDGENVRTIFSTEEIGINPPNSYSIWKHANCTGCLKAGQQHWYVVYCEDNEVFERGKLSEERIGYSFGKEFLKNIEPKFKRMKEIGIPANENIPSSLFWKSAKKYLKKSNHDLFPCECFVN